MKNNGTSSKRRNWLVRVQEVKSPLMLLAKHDLTETRGRTRTDDDSSSVGTDQLEVFTAGCSQGWKTLYPLYEEGV